MHILVPATDTHGYADLDVLRMSRRVYCPDVPMIIAWKGDRPPVGIEDEPGEVISFPQPPDAVTFGHACRLLLAESAETADEDLLFLNDDTVLCPDTLQVLQEDLQLLADRRVGLVGLRSNFVAGTQNIRTRHPHDAAYAGVKWPSESQVIQVRQVFGVAFYVQRSTLNMVPADWTNLHWYSDNLLSYDLAQAGYEHFVSRAYIHHVGSRTGGRAKWAEMDAEGRAWLTEHRPDFPLS